MYNVEGYSSKLQFYHSNNFVKSSFTSCCDVVFTREDLEKLSIDNGFKLEIKTGFAFCSDLDNYCKNTGRTLTRDRLQTQLYKLETIYYGTNNRVQYSLIGQDGVTRLVFSTVKERSYPFFVYADKPSISFIKELD